jgi:hypothetical protein
MHLKADGSSTYEGIAKFSWDFDYNCMRTEYTDYNTFQWYEEIYCKDLYLKYDSVAGCSNSTIENLSIKNDILGFFEGFNVSQMNYQRDPIWA